MRVLITGGSGFVGQRLCERLVAEGHEPQVVSRSPNAARGQLPKACDVRESAQAFLDSPPEVLVNLAGESIAAKRWSDEQKEALIQSRLKATQQLTVLCEQLKDNGQPLPKAMVSASAMGYYGDQGDNTVTEDTPTNDEFAHRLCAKWEAAAKEVEAFGVRLAILRIGLVLDAGGGSLQKMLPPFKLGLGGRFGDGTQFMPWIHREDLVEAIVFLLKEESLSGPFNASAPHPVTNAEFTKTLAKTLNRPVIFPVPAFVLKAMLGEMSRLLLTGADMRPARLEAAGFTFQYPTLDKALGAILR
ncbi:TIGR01777 family oxidoreductase [Vreelandella salicampi]|uniref:TIGR01777 family protein n=1 Tax=Vreelandella salicampi TaxID=1449798 RepID=A0A7Z0LIX5_9GAMM|nr:TIGR01777 family oxidoreductase [Halomonas salicampi]NYS59750.1 TIGR01777 family protein [Halomonas salicampi]